MAMTQTTNTPPLLEFDVLRSFVAIAESGSFTRAAQQVYRSPAAISMQIKRLEETLGHSLFIREARRVRLTPEGEKLLGFGRRLLKLNEEAVSQFVAPSIEGTVYFGSPDDIGTQVLPMALAQFARSHPAVAVNVIVGGSIEMLRRVDAGELDLALITAGNIGQDPTRGEVIYTEPLVWAGREGGVAQEQIPLPLAAANHGCCWRKMALDALDNQDISYRIAYTCDHCAGMEAAMYADLAIAPLPISQIKDPFVQIEGLPEIGEYQILMVHKDRIGSAAETLAGYITEFFRRSNKQS